MRKIPKKKLKVIGDDENGGLRFEIDKSVEKKHRLL